MIIIMITVKIGGGCVKSQELSVAGGDTWTHVLGGCRWGGVYIYLGTIYILPAMSHTANSPAHNTCALVFYCTWVHNTSK